MSAHNHDEEIMKQFGSKTAKKLQKKADDATDEKIRAAIMKTKIKGLTREDALRKLQNAIDDALDPIA